MCACLFMCIHICVRACVCACDWVIEFVVGRHLVEVWSLGIEVRRQSATLVCQRKHWHSAFVNQGLGFRI